MSEVFDKLLASRPVNRAAARVLGGGVHYEMKKEIVQRHWTSPPSTQPITSELRACPSFEDLTGRVFGRFRVVGYLGKFNKSKPPLWLVRCVCGDYESRYAKSIRNSENVGDRCEKCRNLVHLKRHTAWLRNPTAPQAETSLED